MINRAKERGRPFDRPLSCHRVLGCGTMYATAMSGTARIGVKRRDGIERALHSRIMEGR